MIEYITQQGEILDEIIKKYYNSEADNILNIVLEANKFLLDYPLELPPNLKILLPTIETTTAVKKINLWG